MYTTIVKTKIVSIKCRVSIKRTLLNFSGMSLLNVHYHCKHDMVSTKCSLQSRAVQRSEFLGGPSLTDLQNTGGARLGASIDFLKNWGGRGPPGPPGSYGPEMYECPLTKYVRKCFVSDLV